MRLAEKAIKELAPPAKGNRITYDDEVAGFGVRVTRSAARAFVLNYVVDGRERRLTIGAWPVWSATGARRRAKELRIRIDQGEDPLGESQQRRREPTFAEVAAEYLENHAAKKKSGHADKLYLDRDVLPTWGHLKAGDIRRRDVIRLVETKARSTPIAGNRLLGIVRKLFGWAVERELVAANPCLQVRAPARENRVDRVLSEDEIHRFWHALDSTAMSAECRQALRLMLATGQRSGEVCGMLWDEVDIERRLWSIPSERSKNGLAHRVPLTDTALELLRQAPRWGRFVCPSSRGPGAVTVAGVSNAVKANREHFGVAKFTPHDLRRTVASQIAALGVDRLVVGKILNHVDRGVTAIYDRHGYDSEKRKALEMWDVKLSAIISGEAPAKVVAIDD